jgi:Rrf2 family protein
MKISTRGRYGLRAMLELARGYGKGPMLMSGIAERQELSRKHLHSLLTSLKNAGLVHSYRGPGGGFVLARSPERIRLSEILHALEGPLSLVQCVDDGDTCHRARRCAARSVWQRVSSAIEDVLDRVTLRDLADSPGRRCAASERNKKTRRAHGRAGRVAKRTRPASRRPRTKAGVK